MASGLEFGLSRSVVSRFRISKCQIVVRGGILRIEGDDFLELHDRLGELAAFRQEIAYFVDSEFKIGINRGAFLELRQGLLGYPFPFVDRAKIKVDVGFIGKNFRHRLEAGERLLDSAFLKLANSSIEEDFKVVRAEAIGGIQSRLGSFVLARGELALGQCEMTQKQSWLLLSEVSQ